MRRLPFYLLLDCSQESASGGGLQQIDNASQMLLGELEKDRRALELAWVSVITYGASSKVLVPLTDLACLKVPRLEPDRGGCVLGEALALVAARARGESISPSSGDRGDCLPWVVIFSGANPSDDWEKGFSQFSSQRWGTVVAVAGNGSVGILRTIAGDKTVHFDSSYPDDMASWFRWISKSVGTASESINPDPMAL